MLIFKWITKFLVGFVSPYTLHRLQLLRRVVVGRSGQNDDLDRAEYCCNEILLTYFPFYMGYNHDDLFITTQLYQFQRKMMEFSTKQKRQIWIRYENFCLELQYDQNYSFYTWTVYDLNDFNARVIPIYPN